jgi:hypothetical protein
MKNFLEHTYQIVRKSLERYLYQVQQKESTKQEEQKIQEINKQKRQDELTGGTKLRSILRDTKTNSKKLPIIDGLYEVSIGDRRSLCKDCITNFLYFLNRITIDYLSNDISI